MKKSMEKKNEKREKKKEKKKEKDKKKRENEKKKTREKKKQIFAKGAARRGYVSQPRWLGKAAARPGWFPNRFVCAWFLSCSDYSQLVCYKRTAHV